MPHERWPCSWNTGAMSADEIALRTDRARGLMLGLLLADCVDQWDQPGPLTGTCLTQLACFTLEGGIRAHERAIHKGICHVPSVIWHAWCRWADIQGLGPQFAAYWGGQSGWLHQVRPLADRRGSAPTTVNALLASPRAPETPATNASAGHHALTRVLPLAILAPELRRGAGDRLRPGAVHARQPVGMDSRSRWRTCRRVRAVRFVRSRRGGRRRTPRHGRSCTVLRRTFSRRSW